MPYYRAGDYYRGDYYRGNYAAGGIFGSIGKFLGGAAKVVGKVAGAALSATPAGKVIGTAVQLLKPKTQLSPYSIPSIHAPLIDYSGGGMDVNVPGDFNGGAIPTFGRRPGDTGRVGHFKKDGTWTNRARPRMNPGNMKALRRANRRARSFLNAARSAVRYFTPKAPRGKAYVSFKKKSR